MRKVLLGMKVLVGMGVLVSLLAACGDDGGEAGTPDVVSDADPGPGDGDGDGDASSDDGSSGDGSSSAVVDPAPPGQATVRVDGLDLSFDQPGAVDCSITDDSITFSHVTGANEIVFGGGVNRVDGGWIGSIDLRIEEPDGEAGPIAYSLKPEEGRPLDESLFAVEGASMSYSGPMLKHLPSDGTDSRPPADVGTGTISATCG